MVQLKLMEDKMAYAGWANKKLVAALQVRNVNACGLSGCDQKVILMTNNPLKIKGLDGFGLEVVGREPIEMTCNEKNEFYMYTKYKKMGHILHVRNDWKKEE